MSFRALAAVVAISATLTGVSVVPSFAQTTTVENPAPAKQPRHRRHILHPGIGSAESRNVGPSSTVGGNAGVSGAAAGNTSVPGAPSAASVNGGGK